MSDFFSRCMILAHAIEMHENGGAELAKRTIEQCGSDASWEDIRNALKKVWNDISGKEQE